jgi:predicted peroxiredoxin/TusA-related sulfurtransferase
MKKFFLFSLLSISIFRMESVIAQETLDFSGKKITSYIVSNVLEYFKNKPVGEKVLVKTDNYQAIGNDLSSWSEMTGYRVKVLETTESSSIYEFTYTAQKDREKSLAIVISEKELDKLISPLGLAICCILTGYEVNIYFQGPAVKTLEKGFKEKLPGFSSIFSGFARKGLDKIGNVPVCQKLDMLHKSGAKFYVCQPSMEHFGVKEEKLAYQGLVLCEYLTFLEIYEKADLKFFLQ